MNLKTLDLIARLEKAEVMTRLIVYQVGQKTVSRRLRYVRSAVHRKRFQAPGLSELYKAGLLYVRAGGRVGNWYPVTVTPEGWKALGLPDPKEYGRLQ